MAEFRSNREVFDKKFEIHSELQWLWVVADWLVKIIALMALGSSLRPLLSKIWDVDLLFLINQIEPLARSPARTPDVATGANGHVVGEIAEWPIGSKPNEKRRPQKLL